MKKKPKTKEPFTITLTPEVKSGLETLARMRGASRSTLIELLLRREMAKENIDITLRSKDSNA